MVCSITLGPVKPISAFGSAMLTSPNIAKDAATPPVVGFVNTDIKGNPFLPSSAINADTLASKKAMFDMKNTGKVSQYNLFKKYQIDNKLHTKIFNYCKTLKINCFSTPAHPNDVDLLEKFRVKYHKIGSDDAINIPLLKYVAKTKKKIILSTGMCTLSEIKKSVKRSRIFG